MYQQFVHDGLWHENAIILNIYIKYRLELIENELGHTFDLASLNQWKKGKLYHCLIKIVHYYIRQQILYNTT